ncbi:DUF3795 domain-containing protein, partial [Candidatus Sumerlaeota bacterium]|nr:DUF3795 domain-containing protein [Candidatus Sumerlaeota bacterium]
MEKDIAVDPAWAAPCGVCCRFCEFFESPKGLSCGGCLKERLCRVQEPVCWFVTCADQHAIEHCGLCPEFPCEKLFENRQLCAGDNPHIAVFRIGDLALRARMGTVAWLSAKLSGDLPDVCEARVRERLGLPAERRRHRRNKGRWQVTVSLLPAAEAFHLVNIATECQDAGPEGLRLVLPESAADGFARLVSTQRPIEVVGEFPTSAGQ